MQTFETSIEKENKMSLTDLTDYFQSVTPAYLHVIIAWIPPHNHTHTSISSPFVPAGSMHWVNGRELDIFKLVTPFLYRWFERSGQCLPRRSLSISELRGTDESPALLEGKSAWRLSVSWNTVGLSYQGNLGFCWSWLDRGCGRGAVASSLCGGHCGYREFDFVLGGLISPWWIREVRCWAGCCLLVFL